ncbi:MAG TPA: hypothetical protein DCK99_09685 [Blastocatellia bacterium]|jgi:pSer/pThr/pTyr-binding forkhead associated (FHA) protein|nr:hypothetical protein [Blastocatellia bacterium]
MGLVLEVISGPHRGERIKVGVGGIVRVGRTRKADVVLADDFLSSAHFALECDSKGSRLRDLNSRNGTKLNGELIIEAALKNGDRVFAGRTDFTVRLETDPKSAGAPEQILPPARPRSPRTAKKSESRRKVSMKIAASAAEQAKEIGAVVASGVEEKELPPAPVQLPPPIENAPSPAIHSEPSASRLLLDSYEAATPEGRLFHILSNQPQPLMALIDAVHDARVLDLLRTLGEEHQSLYRNEQNAALAPYLVSLPARSELLKQMIQKGWGRQWGVYLTCPLSLSELRQYFRTSLLVTMPDGVELFSRFYDPRFFRDFLENCSAAEAEKFFGPATSYFMEDERPEILLQFSKSKTGPEKKGHLLSVLI